MQESSTVPRHGEAAFQPPVPLAANSLAWAAGLFEGEGSIIYARKNIQLSMSTTDEDILRRFSAVVGGKVYGPCRYTRRVKPGFYKDVFHWRLNGIANVQTALRLFWPWLGIRRRARAAECLAFYCEHPRNPRKLSLAVNQQLSEVWAGQVGGT